MFVMVYLLFLELYRFKFTCGFEMSDMLFVLFKFCLEFDNFIVFFFFVLKVIKLFVGDFFWFFSFFIRGGGAYVFDGCFRGFFCCFFVFMFCFYFCLFIVIFYCVSSFFSCCFFGFFFFKLCVDVRRYGLRRVGTFAAVCGDLSVEFIIVVIDFVFVYVRCLNGFD